MAEKPVNMTFLSSLLAGLVLGLFSGAFWSIWTRKTLSKKRTNHAVFAALSLIKLGLLGTAVWFLITKADVDLIGLLLGLSIQVVLALGKGFQWRS